MSLGKRAELVALDARDPNSIPSLLHRVTAQSAAALAAPFFWRRGTIRSIRAIGTRDDWRRRSVHAQSNIA
jgi:hypothetical protein